MIRDVAVLLQRVAVARAVNGERLSQRHLSARWLSEDEAVEETRPSCAQIDVLSRGLRGALEGDWLAADNFRRV